MNATKFSNTIQAIKYNNFQVVNIQNGMPLGLYLGGAELFWKRELRKRSEREELHLNKSSDCKVVGDQTLYLLKFKS